MQRVGDRVKRMIKSCEDDDKGERKKGKGRRWLRNAWRGRVVGATGFI